MLQSMGSQRVGTDLVTEQQQQIDMEKYPCRASLSTSIPSGPWWCSKEAPLPHCAEWGDGWTRGWLDEWGYHPYRAPIKRGSLSSTQRQRCAKHDIGRCAGNFYLKIRQGAWGKSRTWVLEDRKKRADGPAPSRGSDCREDKGAFWLSLLLDGHRAKGLDVARAVGVQGGLHLAGTTWFSKACSSSRVRNTSVYWFKS